MTTSCHAQCLLGTIIFMSAFKKCYQAQLYSQFQRKQFKLYVCSVKYHSAELGHLSAGCSMFSITMFEFPFSKMVLHPVYSTKDDLIVALSRIHEMPGQILAIFVGILDFFYSWNSGTNSRVTETSENVWKVEVYCGS